MEDEKRKFGKKSRCDRKKIKEIEGATIDNTKEEDEERLTRITDLVIERIENKAVIGKRQQEEEVEREEIKKEI